MNQHRTSNGNDATLKDPIMIEVGTELIDITRENELTDVQALGALVYALVNRYMYDLYSGDKEDLEFLIGVVRDEADHVAAMMDDLMDDDTDVMEMVIDDVSEDTSDDTQENGGYCRTDRKRELSKQLTDLIDTIECFRESDLSPSEFKDLSEEFVTELVCLGWSRKEVRGFRYLMSEMMDGSYDDMNMLEIDALVRYAVCFRDIPFSEEFVSDGIPIGSGPSNRKRSTKEDECRMRGTISFPQGRGTVPNHPRVGSI